MRDVTQDSISKIEEYTRKFGGAGPFFEKILNSLKFPFAIINVDNFEVELCNSSNFYREIKCYELYRGNDKKCSDCPIDMVIEKRGEISIERSGVNIFMIPIFDGDGKVSSIINYSMRRKKIIKEKVVDKMNQKYEDIFYNILQNSQDVVYRYDFIKDKFDYISESVFILMGFPLSEFVKMNFDEFLSRVHVDDAAEFSDGVNQSGELVCSVEYRWKCKDGKYRWFLDKRTWFFDDNRKRICVIGNIKDISEGKEKDAEYDVLEERVALMKSLESKAKERVSLTEKEKIVLWGLCRWPLLNDEELSEKLELKRSTLTAIKNRLREKGWFSLKYIPNFSKLGCQFAGVFDGFMGGGKIRKLNLEFLKKVPEVIFNNYQDEKFFGVFVSDKYVMFKKFLVDFEEENKDSLKMGFNENSFFYDLEDFELRDFSGIVNLLFGLGRKDKSIIYDFKGETVDLNVNEKRVLFAMIQDSNMSSSEIAKKVWVSKPTVIKVKNKLLDEGIVYAVVIPNFRLLGLKYFGRFSYEFDSNLSSELKSRGDILKTILRINGKRKVSKFILFTSEEDYVQEVDLIKETHRKSGVYCRFGSEIFAIQKRGKSFDLEPFVNELLFRDDV